MTKTAEDRRIERIADIEGTGRLVNELIAEAKDHGDGDMANASFRCECGDDLCREALEISRGAYETARQDSMLFIVRPGHVFPDVEDIVEAHDSYDIVKKHENARAAVERTDRRRRR